MPEFRKVHSNDYAAYWFVSESLPSNSDSAEFDNARSALIAASKNES